MSEQLLYQDNTIECVHCAYVQIGVFESNIKDGIITCKKCGKEFVYNPYRVSNLLDEDRRYSYDEMLKIKNDDKYDDIEFPTYGPEKDKPAKDTWLKAINLLQLIFSTAVSGFSSDVFIPIISYGSNKSINIGWNYPNLVLLLQVFPYSSTATYYGRLLHVDIEGYINLNSISVDEIKKFTNIILNVEA